MLAAIVSYYRDDSRILAISLFGSPSRGSWDPYSDVDLDVVLADDIHLDVIEELKRLCDSLAAIDEHSAVIVADGNDAGDIVYV